MSQECRSCPCGAGLGLEAELAHGICNRCRIDAKKPVRKRRAAKPDFVDVPLPGWDAQTGSWGDPTGGAT